MDLLESVVDASHGEDVQLARLGDVADGEREGVLARGGVHARADEEGGPVTVAPSSLGGADDERLGVRGGILGESELARREVDSLGDVLEVGGLLVAEHLARDARVDAGGDGEPPARRREVTAVRRPVVQERAERAILVVLDRGRERALREHVAARRANVAPEVELVAHRVFPALRGNAPGRPTGRRSSPPRPSAARRPRRICVVVPLVVSQKPWNTKKKSFVVGRINGEQQRNVRPSAHTARRDGRVPDPPIFPRVTRRSRRANATEPGPSFDLRPGVRSLDHADSRLPIPIRSPCRAAGRTPSRSSNSNPA